MNIDNFKETSKIIIIDDTEADGLRIQKALNKKWVASVFYHIEEEDDLPDLPIENVRLVFMDLNFGESHHGLWTSPARDAGIALNKLRRFIGKIVFMF